MFGANMAGGVAFAARVAAEKRAEQEASPIDIERIDGIRRRLVEAEINPRDVSIVIPERDFLALCNQHFVGDSASSMRFMDIEILRGTNGVTVWLPAEVVEPNRETLCMEILRCLGRDGVRELPKSASSNGVSPSAKTIGEVGVTASSSGRDNRDSNRAANLSHEDKIIAAKHAIAVYAREKKLPSAEMLATFGELDRAKASGGAAAVGEDFSSFEEAAGRVESSIVRRAMALLAENDVPADEGGMFAMIPENSSLARYLFGAPANINRHAHRLSSESLSRAADQIWGANSGGTYADLVCSRAERLAEMVYRGDSAADRERG